MALAQSFWILVQVFIQNFIQRKTVPFDAKSLNSEMCQPTEQFDETILYVMFATKQDVSPTARSLPAFSSNARIAFLRRW